MSEPELETPLTELYQEDETAWLETMSRLVRERRFQELDFQNLAEFLNDMARRDRREVLSRLASLLAQLLKWEHQPGQRSPSWQATIAVQKQELGDLLESRTLRNYAQDILEKAYERAVKQAGIETGLPDETFPTACPFPLEDLLKGKK